MQENLGRLLSTPLGFAVFFVTLWCFVSFIISLLGGWFALSRRFTKQSEPLGETRTAGPWPYSVSMRSLGSYNNVVRLTAADDGLYPSVLFLFRFGHPPLRIPWNEITVSRTRRFFRQWVVLTLGNEEHIPMRIPERMASKLGLYERVPALALASTSR